mmetsp:Transcript_29906/g.57830  ORF Transcript_29906/g.57830 Transcript_29906/m.57830 type:complete len:132 (-) Transcript_29906:199-594(-)
MMGIRIPGKQGCSLLVLWSRLMVAPWVCIVLLAYECNMPGDSRSSSLRRGKIGYYPGQRRKKIRFFAGEQPPEPPLPTCLMQGAEWLAAFLLHRLRLNHSLGLPWRWQRVRITPPFAVVRWQSFATRLLSS